jgi:hypothetical protein
MSVEPFGSFSEVQRKDDLDLHKQHQIAIWPHSSPGNNRACLACSLWAWKGPDMVLDL